MIPDDECYRLPGLCGYTLCQNRVNDKGEPICTGCGEVADPKCKMKDWINGQWVKYLLCRECYDSFQQLYMED